MRRHAPASDKVISGGVAEVRDLPAIPMLTHFTRTAGTRSAIDNLDSILRDGMIRGATRLIRGKRPVVCLFDATIGESRPLDGAFEPPAL